MKNNPYTAGTKVRFTKVSASENPSYPTPSYEAYKHGKINELLSLPNNYVNECILLQDIEVGKAVQADRYKRNGEEVPGYFNTSKVLTLEEGKLTTLNSIYKLELV